MMGATVCGQPIPLEAAFGHASFVEPSLGSSYGLDPLPSEPLLANPLASQA